ncbi:Protein kinase C-like protein, partial [Fusarium culmorum]
MNDDDAIHNIHKKIEREKALINAANSMRAQTNNEAVRSRLDSQMRDGRRNLQFFEEKLRDIQLRRVNQGVGDMSLGGPADDAGGPPAPPPKDASSNPAGDRGSYGSGSGQYSQAGGGSDLMPPVILMHRDLVDRVSLRHAPTLPNLIKYDTPHLGPRIQLMLSQIQFKLNVEEQYLKGIEKMVQLYSMEGDRKSKADAAARKVESKQKILLLKQALKRYEELHIDADVADAQDDDSINAPNLRKPLSGQLSIRMIAIKDVDHAATGRFTRGPETFIAVKVEDTVMARTKASRNDRWEAEFHTIEVDKANEIELTVYDKPGEHPMPIGMLWVRISDIVEEIRRKRIEAEMNSSGWVSADRMGSTSAAPTQDDTGPFGAAGPQPQVQTGPIEEWFNLEPTGQIQLQLTFNKSNNNSRPADLGLGRKGAVRQRKEEVHEMYGHKFVQHQFYNIMRCALCGDFLKYSAGMQCEDCKYTCHTKCYSSVVTKCISKSNAETDPDEEKINHRIPHRFNPYSNMTANWCCHCGYILPFGKKNCRKCSECGLTAHAQCVHLVPDFCGMSMAVANQILDGIRTQKQRQAKVSSLSEKTLRHGKTSPTSTSSPAPSYSSTTAPSYQSGPVSPEATEAAKMMYSNPSTPRPAGPDRTSSSSQAAAAASAAMSGGPSAAQRQNSDFGRYSGGYDQPQEDPYAQGGQYGAGQQRKYNPADYANVNPGYGGQQPAAQAQRPVQQQPAQQPPPQSPLPPVPQHQQQQPQAAYQQPA